MNEKQFVAPAQGVEPRTYALEGRCSIQLSYTGINIVTLTSFTYMPYVSCTTLRS